ncbi:MAG: hypothetical protein J7555_04150, partial [Chloroflexi bacterium]|nr:hypothetical protein [Chloroflexota bacterium]
TVENFLPQQENFLPQQRWMVGGQLAGNYGVFHIGRLHTFTRDKSNQDRPQNPIQPGFACGCVEQPAGMARSSVVRRRRL